MADLYSTVWQLRAPAEGATIPASNGYYCYAAVLDAIRSANARLADRLKAGGGRRLLTVSSVLAPLRSRARASPTSSIVAPTRLEAVRRTSRPR